MKSSKEILGSIIKTAQMGQSGIESVIGRTTKTELGAAMESQLKEYGQIEAEAKRIARNRNWNLPDLTPAVRMMSSRMSQMRLAFGQPDSIIAAMMIQGNVSGMIKGQKNLNHATDYDEEIDALTRKLLKTEASNIQQMRPYL